METKTCEYRNCEQSVGSKPNKKFCCDNHRKMESTYKKREKNEKIKLVKLLKEAYTIYQNKDVLDIYKKIYG